MDNHFAGIEMEWCKLKNRTWLGWRAAFEVGSHQSGTGAVAGGRGTCFHGLAETRRGMMVRTCC